MGEYAEFQGRRVKIGTCESMYYLRADQRRLVRHVPGNVDPGSSDALSIRFRFPWPDEDAILPGGFDEYNRSVTANGLVPPEGAHHYNLQFRHDRGMLVSLPCPFGPGPHHAEIGFNGFAGAVRLVQQKLLADGRLVPVCECGACGSAWRLEEPAEIQALAEAFYAEGNLRRANSTDVDGNHVGHVFWHTIADRILLGAKLQPRPVLR